MSGRARRLQAGGDRLGERVGRSEQGRQDGARDHAGEESRPTRAPRFRRKRRSQRRWTIRRPGGAAIAGKVATDSAAFDVFHARRTRGYELGVDHVDEEVEGYVDRGDDEHRRLDDRVVPLLDRLDHQTPTPGQPKIVSVITAPPSSVAKSRAD